MVAVRQFIIGPELHVTYVSGLRCKPRYHYLAVSRNIPDEDLAEISAWAARSGDLLGDGNEAVSCNFHPLPSGDFCLSRTARLPVCHTDKKENDFLKSESFTHGVILPNALLKDYANNALAVYRHFTHLGLWDAGVEVASQLLVCQKSCLPSETLPVMKTLEVDGSSVMVHTENIYRCGRILGTRRLVQVLDQMLGSVSMLVAIHSDLGVTAEDVFEALLEMLPLSVRLEFSFATSLKFSAQRPFNLLGVGENLQECQRVRKNQRLPVFMLGLRSKNMPPITLKRHWSMFMHAVLQHKALNQWETLLITEETPITVRMLGGLAERYLRHLGLDKKGVLETSEEMGVVSTLQQEKVHHASLDDSAPVGTECALLAFTSHLAAELNADLSSLDENVSDAIPAVFSEISPDEVFAQEPGEEKILAAPSAPSSPSASILEIQKAAFLEAIRDASHGNPVATERLREIWTLILKNTSPSQREQEWEILMQDSLKVWNQQRSVYPNRSSGHVGRMAEILYILLDLWMDTSSHT